jgi:enoyl-CoA hydratase
MTKTFSVYIVASRSRVLYIGITSDLHERVWKHKTEQFEGFSQKYKTKNLVYFENFESFQSAVDREKQLKGWRRSKKIALIESKNPSWSDLSSTWYSASAEVLRLVPPALAHNDSSREWITIDFYQTHTLLRLHAQDTMNRLTWNVVLQLTNAIGRSIPTTKPLILTGNNKFFSAGADLNEIIALSAPEAFEFARMGQRLMNAVANFPAPTFAAINGYCMGGGLDLALACQYRIASSEAIFGHRGAALGLLTGWGGTQRLPRLIGKARALQLLCAAEKLTAESALRAGLINAIADNPAAAAIAQIAH